MKILFIIFIFVAGSSHVHARIPPGSPPWKCVIIQGCDGRGKCDDVIGAIIYFQMAVSGEERFKVTGFRDRSFSAATFPSLSAAKWHHFWAKNDDPIGMYFVMAEEIGDAHSFRIYSTDDISGKRNRLSKSYLLAACS